MKILIDTNIILDLIQNREPHTYNASIIINSCVTKKIAGFISAHSLSDLFFILRKYKSVEERKSLILNLCMFFTVIQEGKDDFISICNNPNWKDLEDGLQMKCAEKEKLDFIISRDKENGFNDSPVKIITPEEFLKLYKT